MRHPLLPSVGQHIRVGVEWAEPAHRGQAALTIKEGVFLATSTVSAEVPWSVRRPQLQRRQTDVSLPGPLCQSVPAEEKCRVHMNASRGREMC